MDDFLHPHPDDDPSWLPPEDLTDAEMGIGVPLSPYTAELLRRRERERRERWRRLEDTPLPEPVTLAPDTLGTFLRALRWRGRLSQRELAAAAGVPATTVDRLERADVRDPRLSTMVRLAGACGLRLAVIDDEGTQLAVPYEQTTFHDRADRLLPAHLPTFDPQTSRWWGDGRYQRKGEKIRKPARASRGRRRVGTYRDGQAVE